MVGHNVKHWRTKRGFSQEELAFRSELHRTYVSAVERGIRNPTVLIVGKLAAALGVRPVMLLDDYAGRADDVILGMDSEK
ncbi:MAG TPA: helix-turn-helix transcriptional regulator [Rhabdaerophilum sp.]|nr:helix-turn-helix transcriptional regulator [Rhabdaerophilum sp.]